VRGFFHSHADKIRESRGECKATRTTLAPAWSAMACRGRRQIIGLQVQVKMTAMTAQAMGGEPGMLALCEEALVAGRLPNLAGDAHRYCQPSLPLHGR
jgi:hypothetical protein